MFILKPAVEMLAVPAQWAGINVDTGVLCIGSESSIIYHVLLGLLLIP